MDELVRQGLARWPNVPDCYGWLALDARGRWRVGQERQAITHTATIGFIGRNYFCDDAGRWLFQNGPQRVFVDLEYTPLVERVIPAGQVLALRDHTGRECRQPQAVWIDDGGSFLVRTDAGVGLVHDHDSALLLELVKRRDGTAIGDEELLSCLDPARSEPMADLALFWPGAVDLLPIELVARQLAPSRLGFIQHPRAPEARPPD